MAAFALPLLLLVPNLRACDPPPPTGFRPCGSVAGWSCSVEIRGVGGTGTYAIGKAATTRGATFISMTFQLEFLNPATAGPDYVWHDTPSRGSAVTRKTVRYPNQEGEWFECEDRPGKYRWHLRVNFANAPKATFYATSPWMVLG
jgi:hypothetical protein